MKISLVSNIQFLTMSMEVLCRITNAGAEDNLTCIELQNIIDQTAEICDCECNEDNVTEIDVIYNPTTNKFNLD